MLDASIGQVHLLQGIRKLKCYSRYSCIGTVSMHPVSFESAGWCEFASFAACAIVDESPTCFPSALCRTAGVAFGSWSKVGATSAKQTQASQMRDETFWKLHRQRAQQVSCIYPTCRTNSILNLKYWGKKAKQSPPKNKLQTHALERSIDPYVLPLLFQPSAQRQTFFQLHLAVFLVTWLAPQTRPVWCAAANKQQHLKYFEVTWQCEPECNSMDIKPCHCDGANQMGWSKPK